MKNLLIELPSFQSSLTATAATLQSSAVDPRMIDGFIRAMRRKCNFALTHLRLLEAVDWGNVDGLGREQTGLPMHASVLNIKLQDATLEIRHPGAVIDHVYLAADGLIASLANLTDTFARVTNIVYQLGVHERKASLFAICNACTPNSPLAILLNDRQHRTWLERVRDLRGRCQHADIEEILATPNGILGRRTEPYVPADYCWHQSPSIDTPLAAYAKYASDATEQTLIAAIRVIVTSTANPTK